MSEHTPGPWEIKETSGPSYGSTVYWVPGVCHHINIAANAHLIAAAPELLEALKVARHTIKTDVLAESRTPALVLAKIDAAIAKAEGR